MNIEVLTQNVETGKIYDITELISTITLEQSIEGEAGYIEFSFKDILNKKYIVEGSSISFKVNGLGIFWGYVFKISESEKNEIKIKAYDQLRYFKSKDTYVFSNMTCIDIFKKICNDYNIKFNVIATTNYILEQRIHDNKTLADIVQFGFDRTIIDTKKWLFMRDNFGTLEVLDINSEKTKIVIGDESLLSTYSLERSIEESYNQVKLIREDKEKKKREIYITKDSNNIKKWGLLQFSEKVDEKMNDAQIKERADALLKKYNKVNKTLNLGDCIGDFRVKAGTGVVIAIKALEGKIPYEKYALVTKVKHTISNCKHIMNLEVRFE